SATFDAVQVGIMVVSPEGRLLRANPEAERALGIEVGTTEFVGGSLDFEMLTLDGAPMPPAERPVAGALRGFQVRGTMMRLRWADGREMCIHANAVPLWHEGETQPYAAVCSFLDVTAEVEQRRRLDERFAEVTEINIVLEAQRYELERANERLAALATTDGLTGLLNHRAFHERLETETRVAHRSGAPLSLLLMDVDRFKLYNDRFGHPAGDAILREFARVLAEFGRVGDVMARYGGEEFVAILPDTDTPASIAVAERFRHAIETAPWPDHPVTASFGAATLADHMGGDALVRAADAALYASKRAGRNRTTHAHEIAA
ncbi:diguanylate cyclase, partial [bacterium]